MSRRGKFNEESYHLGVVTGFVVLMIVMFGLGIFAYVNEAQESESKEFCESKGLEYGGKVHDRNTFSCINVSEQGIITDKKEVYLDT